MSDSWATACINDLHGLKPALLMVLVQSLYALVNVFCKLAANDGMSVSVLVAYRLIFGAASIAPVAFLAERRKRSKLTWKIVMLTFLGGLFGGSLELILFLKSLVLTSATFISAMANLIPAITFIMAICLRLEKPKWNNAAGKAKVLGTIMGMGGATILTLYKGPYLNIWTTNINLLEITTSHPHGGQNLVLGSLLAFAACVSYSLWLIVQAKVAEQFPCPYSITAIMTFWASVQSVGFALCTESHSTKWVLGWDIRLLTVVVSGVFGSGLAYTLVAWCIKTKGPVFVSIFQPLMLLMVAFCGFLFLEEKLHLGMVFGSILIVCGLYVVLWGNDKELKASQLMSEKLANQVELDMPPSLPPTSQTRSSHGSGIRKEMEEERENEKRNSHGT